MIFFRFLRPVAYNIYRNEISTLSHGGICFKLNILDSSSDTKLALLGISVCEFDQVFNREVSKKRADDYRWVVEIKSFAKSNIIESILSENIYDAISYFSALPADQLLYETLDEIRHYIKRINAINHQAYLNKQNHLDSIKALKLKRLYNEKQ